MDNKKNVCNKIQTAFPFDLWLCVSGFGALHFARSIAPAICASEKVEGSLFRCPT